MGIRQRVETWRQAWYARRSWVCERKGHKFFVELSFGPTWCIRCNAPNDMALDWGRRLGKYPE